MKSLLLRLGLIVSVACFTGCAHVEPWQRAKLAHYSMASGTFAGPAEEHVHGVQEGAAGGGASAESGCGCN